MRHKSTDYINVELQAGWPGLIRKTRVVHFAGKEISPKQFGMSIANTSRNFLSGALHFLVPVNVRKDRGDGGGWLWENAHEADGGF